jgi:hypothetical protein
MANELININNFMLQMKYNSTIRIYLEASTDLLYLSNYIMIQFESNIMSP